MWDTREGEVSGSWFGLEKEAWRLFSERGTLLQDGN